MPDTCPNCDAPSSERYCPRCGQDNADARLDARRVLGNALTNLVGWDSALGRTASGLVKDPGGTVADYVSGRRRRYVNPARLCLLALAAWFLATRLIGADPMDTNSIQFQVTGEAAADQDNLWLSVREFLGRSLDILLYLSLPLYALVLRLLFRRTGRNLAECLVLVLFVESLHFFLGFLLVPLVPHSPEAARTIRTLIYLVWTARAARRFFDVGWKETIWRIAVCKVLHIALTLLLFAGVAISWVLLTGG